MGESVLATTWNESILALARYVASGKLASVVRSVIGAWDLVGQLRDRLGYRGMYEILEYDSTLELLDARGKKARLVRREVIRFLQDNVVAIQDHGWGSGKLFAEYRCQPGVPVDFYEDGAKHNVLISLRETKNRGDMIELWSERVIKGGFLRCPWWLETEIDHLTRHLRLSIIFPKQRPCRQASLARKSTKKTVLLGAQHFRFFPDGRQRLTWETKAPKLNDLYTIKWDW
jgi:hypothetical protein